MALRNIREASGNWIDEGEGEINYLEKYCRWPTDVVDAAAELIKSFLAGMTVANSSDAVSYHARWR